MDLEAGEGDCCDGTEGNCSPLDGDNFFGDPHDEVPQAGQPEEVKPEGQLTLEEKKFLLAVERGDLATARR